MKIATDDIASVSTVGNRYVVTLWTAEGLPIEIGSFTSASAAATVVVNVASAVRGWVEASR